MRWNVMRKLSRSSRNKIAKLDRVRVTERLEKDGITGQSIVNLTERTGGRQLRQSQSDAAFGSVQAVATRVRRKTGWQHGQQTDHRIGCPTDGRRQLGDFEENLVQLLFGESSLQSEPLGERFGDDRTQRGKVGQILFRQDISRTQVLVENLVWIDVHAQSGRRQFNPP